MNLTTLIPIAILIAAVIFIKLLPRLIVRQVARVAFSKIGEKALANVPEQIQLAQVAAPQWKNSAVVQQQAGPLLQSGFSDLGTFSVDKMPGALLRMLFHAKTFAAAHIFEHPKAGNWIEFVTRYTDGSGDYLATLPDQGIASPPWVRMVRADQRTPTDRLFQHHLAQREVDGIKPVAAREVVHEFEDAYMRYMIWKNNKGITPEEVAHVMRRWAQAKGAGQP